MYNGPTGRDPDSTCPKVSFILIKTFYLKIKPLSKKKFTPPQNVHFVWGGGDNRRLLSFEESRF